MRLDDLSLWHRGDPTSGFALVAPGTVCPYSIAFGGTRCTTTFARTTDLRATSHPNGCADSGRGSEVLPPAYSRVNASSQTRKFT